MAAEVSPRRHNSPLRQAQAAATRLGIIEAAHAEFEARGYEGTRIEDIAARAGVAVPTVYKTFTNKRNLLTAAVTTALTGGRAAAHATRLTARAAHLSQLVRATATRDSEIATLWHNINNERLARARTSAQRL